MVLHKKANIIIISHFSFKYDEESDVFPQNIRDHVRNKVKTVTYIDHPFPDAVKFPASQLRIYSQKNILFNITTPKLMLPTLLLFGYQFFLTTLFLLIKPKIYDLCIACDNLSFLSVYVLRRIGLVKKLVYYTIDYTPQRYKNNVLNSLYHFFDRLASRISDVNWVAVDNMISAKSENGLDVKKSSPFQVVQMGFNQLKIFENILEATNRFHLVFVGLLFEKQGVQLAIDALPELLKKFPEMKLTIIGSGPFEGDLKNLVAQKNLSHVVFFLGFLSDQREISKFLVKNAGIGLATYDPSIGDYTYHADPSKIKLYLLCGLPIITTRVPQIAEKIKDKKAGITIDYSTDSLIHGIETILDKKETYKIYRKNALIMGRSYDISKILEVAFRKL